MVAPRRTSATAAPAALATTALYVILRMSVVGFIQIPNSTNKYPRYIHSVLERQYNGDGFYAGEMKNGVDDTNTAAKHGG